MDNPIHQMKKFLGVGGERNDHLLRPTNSTPEEIEAIKMMAAAQNTIPSIVFPKKSEVSEPILPKHILVHAEKAENVAERVAMQLKEKSPVSPTIYNDIWMGQSPNNVNVAQQYGQAIAAQQGQAYAQIFSSGNSVGSLGQLLSNMTITNRIR